jgi:DNA-binding XRE family transcriptional regulator
MTLAALVRAGQLPSPAERQEIRTKARVSLHRLGQAIGVSAVTVMRWERGDAEPTLEHAVAYRRLLDQLRQATG